MVSFPDAVKMFFNRYTDFDGRSRRSEYWWVQLFFWVILIVFAVTAALANGGDLEGDTNMVANIILGMAAIFYLGCLIPLIALAVRRFHDLGQTGWLVLVFGVLSLIPLLGLLVALGNVIWFCLRGTVGDNKYGPDPYLS